MVAENVTLYISKIAKIQEISLTALTHLIRRPMSGPTRSLCAAVRPPHAQRVRASVVGVDTDGLSPTRPSIRLRARPLPPVKCVVRYADPSMTHFAHSWGTSACGKTCSLTLSTTGGHQIRTWQSERVATWYGACGGICASGPFLGHDRV